MQISDDLSTSHMVRLQELNEWRGTAAAASSAASAAAAAALPVPEQDTFKYHFFERIVREGADPASAPPTPPSGPLPYERVVTESRGGLVAEGNMRSKVCRRLSMTVPVAARVIEAFMRKTGAKLGGVYVTCNAGQCFSCEPVTSAHFILGDLLVVDAAHSPCRFDETMTLKEDYDFTAQHLHEHGTVCRVRRQGAAAAATPASLLLLGPLLLLLLLLASRPTSPRLSQVNRMLINPTHRTNAGGAVDDRDASGAKEDANIAILRRKWGAKAFADGRRAHEVVMKGDKVKLQPGQAARPGAALAVG